MKDNANVLESALRLAKKKQFDAAIRLLESEILRFRESYKYYNILALSCMYAGDFGRAYTYFKSAYDIKKDAASILGIAAINLRRGESERAIDLYLKVLDMEPHNKKAQKALAILRKYSGSDDLIEWAASGKMKSLYPPFPRVKINVKKILLVSIAAFAVCAAAAASAALKLNLLPSLSAAFSQDAKGAAEKRAGFNESALEKSERDSLVDLSGSFQFVLGEKEVASLYDEAHRDFGNYDDNKARLSLNKLLLSNAGEGIKNKARLMLSYIERDAEKTGFDNLKSNFPYTEVERSPALYAGCFVIWKGMAANIDARRDSTAFDLLVGYEEKSRLLGIVRVRCPFAAALSSDAPLEVLGRVVLPPDVLSSGGGGFSLEGVSLHQSLR